LIPKNGLYDASSNNKYKCYIFVLFKSLSVIVDVNREIKMIVCIFFEQYFFVEILFFSKKEEQIFALHDDSLSLRNKSKISFF